MEIRITEDLWNCSVHPQGLLERWRHGTGDIVAAGTAVAEVRVEDCLHEIVAPCSGVLSTLATRNYIVKPGETIGCVTPLVGRGGMRPTRRRS